MFFFLSFKVGEKEDKCIKIYLVVILIVKFLLLFFDKKVRSIV